MKAKKPEKIEALIVKAIRGLQDVQGSTPKEITNYISQEYDVPGPEVKKQVQLALKRGITYGILQRLKGGYYTYNREFLPGQPADADKKSLEIDCNGRKSRRRRSKGRGMRTSRLSRGRRRSRRRGRRGKSRRRSRRRSRRGRSRRGRRRGSRRRTKRRRRRRSGRRRKDIGEMEMETMANDSKRSGSVARKQESPSEDSLISGGSNEAPANDHARGNGSGDNSVRE